MTGSMVDAALENATAVTMSADDNAIGSNGIEYELDTISCEAATVRPREDYLLGHLPD